ncbi:hypothetical protein ABB37_03651 [Leptomonas pyrrhocoris]|uniref:Uncharacterized protein n=1 Tax=Leptomonas pyrrhocoris TaxID=157538 RepID=A0A0N0VFQ2_LEPPY|nr:hypothetical protein ABB37_03651 [Leptomonas pyrrhocoris]KPA81232.1 hypothetical protein ABB37_03651 [Leptomonas pyrrhocoris]|eukprot:XP_015659671.1 hypothetical protein ABB37_03651 [Leptomonas pyrrhocoris]
MRRLFHVRVCVIWTNHLVCVREHQFTQETNGAPWNYCWIKKSSLCWQKARLFFLTCCLRK